MGMSPLALIFLFVSVVALLLLPRRQAPLPFLAGACYMTLEQGFEVGPFTFPILRTLILIGAIRVIVRGERLNGSLNRLDWMMVAWAVWAAASSAFHNQPVSALVYRLGLVYNACGIYFLLRIFCSSLDDVVLLGRTTALVLSVVALAMLNERLTQHNVFSIFGVPDIPFIREGQLRALGPFAHPILAGTVGGVCLPLMIGLWSFHRATALVGIVACLTMVITSASSGPIMSTACAVCGLLMWRFRYHMRTFRWGAVAGLTVLSVVMKAPIYYLIARIDIVGGSTGWYRSRLIESSIEHLREWWFAGTDFTGNWMAQAMVNDPTQVDITNHYLKMGVWGGMPLLLLFVGSLAMAFSFVGIGIRAAHVSERERFILWTFGCGLVSHAATFLSVSYFDQSFVFLYLNLAIMGSIPAHTRAAAADAERLLPGDAVRGAASSPRWSPAAASPAPFVWAAARPPRAKAG